MYATLREYLDSIFTADELNKLMLELQNAVVGTKIRKSLCLWGMPHCGKSTFMQLLRQAFATMDYSPVSGLEYGFEDLPITRFALCHEDADKITYQHVDHLYYNEHRGQYTHTKYKFYGTLVLHLDFFTPLTKEIRNFRDSPFTHSTYMKFDEFKTSFDFTDKFYEWGPEFHDLVLSWPAAGATPN